MLLVGLGVFERGVLGAAVSDVSTLRLDSKPEECFETRSVAYPSSPLPCDSAEPLLPITVPFECFANLAEAAAAEATTPPSFLALGRGGTGSELASPPLEEYVESEEASLER